MKGNNTRDIPFFVIDYIDEDGGLQVKDKEGLHICIVDYIEDLVENNYTIDNDIICYLIYGDEEKGVNIVLEDEDGSFIDSGWVEMDENNSILDWDSVSLENMFDDDGLEISGSLNGIEILKELGADVYEIILQNNEYIDPLDKALDYFESIENYEECERIKKIKDKTIEWMQKNKMKK